MAVKPPFSTKLYLPMPLTNRTVNGTKHMAISICALFIFCLQLTSTAKTNDCALLGIGGCRGQGWDNGEWPILLKGQKSLSECCKECTKKQGCSSFHIGKLKEEKADCFLFSHTAIVPVKTLGGECYQLKKEKQGNSNDEDDGPTEEQCKKFVTKACQEKKAQAEQKSKQKPISKQPDKGKSNQATANVDKSSAKAEETAIVNDNDEDDDDEENETNEAAATKDNESKGKQKEGKKETKKDEKTVAKDKSGANTAKKPEDKQKPKENKNDESKTEDKKSKKEQKEKAAPKETAKPITKEAPAVSKSQEVKKEEKSSAKSKSSAPDGDSVKQKSDAIEKENAEKEKPKEKAKKPQPEKVEKEKAKKPQPEKVEKQKAPEPKGKPKTAKKVDTGPKKYDGQYLKLVGHGGCRGKNWNTKNCPKFLGRKTLDQCAMECRKAGFCTAFHILKPEKDQTFDCLLFSHKELIAVEGLGGLCYTFSDRLPQQIEENEAGLDDQDDEEEEDETNVITGPIVPLLLGEGFCRGPKWTFQHWPIPKGRLSNQDCAEECAKKKGCTAYDVSMEHKGKFDCLLYGHKGVVPALGVSSLPAKCYVLKGSLLSKLLDEEDIVEEEIVEEDEDGGDEEDVGEVGFTLLGKGMCRGPKWQSRQWPKSKGLKSINQCAAACLRNQGCRSFDMSPPDSRKHGEAGKGKLWCNLYSNKDVKPSSGVPGNCYRVQKDASELSEIVEDEEMVIDDDIISVQEVDDSLLNSIPKEGQGFKNLGKGFCRGPNWQIGKTWPKDDGKETFEECLKECRKNKGCTAFDVSPAPNSIKFQCILYGHQDVRPASYARGRCIKMTGRQALPSAEEQVVEGGEGFISVGEGLCRGTNWQTLKGKWPVDKGMKTLKECYGSCQKTGGCTAFDIRDPDEKKKYHCYLFGHQDIISASSQSGTCYKITGLISQDSDDEDSIDPSSTEDGIVKLGDGPCRGLGWQSSNSKWPTEKGVATASQCGEACSKTQGCTAFDLRESEDDNKKSICTLYGHVNVVPASGVSKVKTKCYDAPKKGFVSKSPKIETAKVKETPKKPKVYKIPEFEEPKVIYDEEDGNDDDDEWLFEPPPPEVRSRDHINEILDQGTLSNLKLEEKHLKTLKKIYETSIKPLEATYKYQELSNRHFGDPEIFNKPLVVLMGPWSGGKSTMINYFLGTEYTKNAFRAAAEPSPGFNFNIAMYGDQDEELDGTELAAEWTFSSLQKFGQEFLKKLRGKKMANKLLQKATFAEIPGVLETGSKRKVDRLYPFNEACQWFIDHADLILLVYDYTKLDIGPETEALLDQLKGRESQVRIILNKADEITAEELLKIQGNLLWNVSPLMSSLEPPTLYAGSFWSHPYKDGAPKNLLNAQERSLLKDIREAMDKRIVNRIATARRFAVRVRNHAKMVDCYLTTYNNKKTTFGNKKKIEDDIVQNPEKYHIYEGISSMTNISRYDLPDPDTYKTFFGLHPLPEFQTLQSTCEYFKGCPINKLDMAIAYELPEALTAYKRESGASTTNKKQK